MFIKSKLLNRIAFISLLAIAIPENIYAVTITSIGSNIAPTAATAGITTNPSCSNFHPGMEFRVSDDNTRGVDGLAALKSNLAQDVKNFNAVIFQINWGMIEKTPGLYNWSRIDQAFALAQNAGKYFRVRIEDRTFWTGCNSAFIPPWIARASSSADSLTCYAKIWTDQTMSQYISLVTALVKRYSSNPYFMGIATEETAMDANSFQLQSSLVITALYPQLERLANAVHAVNPNILFTQYINWPYKNQNTYLAPVVSNLVSSGSGVGIGWPDTVVANQNSWSWYQFARDNYSKLVVAPDIQSVSVSNATTVTASLADHEAAYQMLNTDVHANIIVWDTWNKQFGDQYFTQVVIPTVNNHNGAVSNTTCPFN